MNHDEYTTAVDQGKWPSDSLVPLDDPFINENGVIQNLLLKPANSFTIIHSKPSSIRANHYHKTDWHYSYVVSGRIIYFERKVGDTIVPEPQFYESGKMFFTPPMVEHVMYFPEQTTFVTMAKNIRSHESHESDVVRVSFLDLDQIRDLCWKALRK